MKAADPTRLAEAINAVILGAATPEQAALLEARLCEDPDALEEYERQMELHIHLNVLCCTNGPLFQRDTPRRARSRIAALIPLLFCLLTAAAGVTAYIATHDAGTAAIHSLHTSWSALRSIFSRPSNHKSPATTAQASAAADTNTKESSMHTSNDHNTNVLFSVALIASAAFTLGAEPQPLIFDNKANNNLWDTSSANWHLAGTPAQPNGSAVFQNGDNATFSGQRTVLLAEDITVHDLAITVGNDWGRLLLDGDTTLTLTGTLQHTRAAGSNISTSYIKPLLAGPGRVVVNRGPLRLENSANSFTGGVDVPYGTLEAFATSPHGGTLLGSGTLALGAASNALDSATATFKGTSVGEENYQSALVAKAAMNTAILGVDMLDLDIGTLSREPGSVLTLTGPNDASFTANRANERLYVSNPPTDSRRRGSSSPAPAATSPPKTPTSASSAQPAQPPSAAPTPTSTQPAIPRSTPTKSRISFPPPER